MVEGAGETEIASEWMRKWNKITAHSTIVIIVCVMCLYVIDVCVFFVHSSHAQLLRVEYRLNVIHSGDIHVCDVFDELVYYMINEKNKSKSVCIQWTCAFSVHSNVYAPARYTHAQTHSTHTHWLSDVNRVDVRARSQASILAKIPKRRTFS